MTDVDAILASGRYVDRRGHTWVLVGGLRIGGVALWGVATGDRTRLLTSDQMRLKITRDQHRNECEGLAGCISHPTPHVVTFEGVHFAYRPRADVGTMYHSFAEAVAAAHNMTGDER